MHRAQCFGLFLSVGRRRFLCSALACVALLLQARTASAVPPPADVKRLIDNAKAGAQNALNKAECRMLLQDKTGAGVFIGGESQVLPTTKFDFVEVARPPLRRTDAASTKFLGGFNQTITIYRRFARVSEVDPILYNPNLRFEVNGLDPNNQRIVLLLHELGHLTGAEGVHNDEAQYNVDIANLCLDAVRVRPEPPQRSACTFNGWTVADGQSVVAYERDRVGVCESCYYQSRVCNNGVLDGWFEYPTCSGPSLRPGEQCP